jgi:hypothetical protein
LADAIENAGAVMGPAMTAREALVLIEVEESKPLSLT